MTEKETILEAYNLAVRDLRACYNPEGIVAGRTHFNAYWARDGFWAVFGALELGDYKQALLHLELFAKYQRQSGELPARIEFLTRSFWRSFWPYKTRLNVPRSIFRAGQFVFKPVDPTALFVIAIWQYYRHTSDQAFLEKFTPLAQKAVDWLFSFDKDGDGLLETGYLSDWMDSILKRGKILNINVIYAKALHNLAKIYGKLGQQEQARIYRTKAHSVCAKIRTVFWTGRYFADWIDGNKRGSFTADGNVLAILFEIATPQQTQTIFNYIQTNQLDQAHPLLPAWPPYRWTQVFITYWVAGITDYHSKLIWPWIGAINALNKYRHKKQKEALADLALIGEWYLKNAVVAEVYEKTGKPVSRPLYEAEQPFAWNAACYIYAVRSIGLVGKHKVKEV